MNRTNLFGMSLEEIRTIAGSGDAHARRIANLLYKKGMEDIMDYNDVPKVIREELNRVSLIEILKPVKREISSDGSVKYLFRNVNNLEFETVFLPDGKRNTVCVSSQSGCRMNCQFCATGKYGFKGSLSESEILSQVIGIPEYEKVTNVVFMGMGEPMDNLDNVLKACNILAAEWGCALGRSNITVSTVGILKGVAAFLESSRFNLTLSLYSPFHEERIRAVPAEKNNPVRSLIDMMKKHTGDKRRRMSIAYVMIDGVNDSVSHLNAIRSLLSGTGIHINILPYHPIPVDEYVSSPRQIMERFRHDLVISGISASIRRSRGIDISAACGLLAAGLNGISDCY